MEIRFKGVNNLSVNERKKFYDEALYMRVYNKKITKNPRRRVTGLTKFFLKIVAFATVMCILFIFLIFKHADDSNNETMYKILLGSYIVLSILLISATILNKIKIKALADKEEESEVKIDKNNVIYRENNKEITLNWDEIDYIIINNYTFTFVSSKIDHNTLSLPATYKEQMLQAIKDAGYLSLIVNNHDKYL